MPIKKVTHRDHSTDGGKVETFFYGRTLRVEELIEERNWSDTSDYSDYRTTKCTYALVYIGPRGVPPIVNNRVYYFSSGPKFPRPVTYVEPCSWQEERELTDDEQFAWIDCTNLFADRMYFTLTAEADSNPMQLAFCGPEVLEKFLAWEARQAEKAAKLEQEHKSTLEAAEKKKRAAEAKEAANREQAEKLLATVPRKGTTVTVDGFTGQIFWSGMKKYNGKWSVRAGVKSTAGTVIWIDAAVLQGLHVA